MEPTPRLPTPPAPLETMCRDLWWKTFSAHPANRHPPGLKASGMAEWPRAGVVSLRRAVCCLDARWRTIWWQKIGARRRNVAPNLVFLRTRNSTIKMQSAAIFVDVFFVFDDSPYVGTAYRLPAAAALRNLRRRHRQYRKITARRVAPARLCLQMRRLPQDHIGRGGAAGRHVPSSDDIDAAATALIAIDLIRKRISPNAPRVSSRLRRV